jgi:hypothetical protein
MATYIENELNFNDNSIIEYSLSLWGTPRIKVFVGLSEKTQHLGKFTFLDENKKDTIYGNGCRFNSMNQAIEYIKSDIKSQINKGQTPVDLIIDGKVCLPFIKIHEMSLL